MLNNKLADYIALSKYNYIYPFGTLPSNLFYRGLEKNPYLLLNNMKSSISKKPTFYHVEEESKSQELHVFCEKKNKSINRNRMSNLEVTPQNLAKSANEYAPLFVEEASDDWDTLCQLIATELGQNYKTDLDKIRVFVLKSNTGTNDDKEAVYFPVVAKNTKDGIKDKEASTSRPELAMAQLQDMDDVIDQVSRGSGSYRVSSSTGISTFYGTAGINKGYFGTTQYILKLAIKEN